VAELEIPIGARLDERSSRATAEEARRYFERAGQDVGEGFNRSMSASIERSAPSVRASLTQVIDAERDLARVSRDGTSAGRDAASTQRDLTSARSQAVRETTALTRSVEDLNRAHLDSATAADASARSHTDMFDQVSEGGRGATAQMASLGSTIGGLSRVGGPVIIAMLADGLVTLGGVAASASQSVMLLPAAIGAAGAAFGTLALATQGFGDAMSSLGDPAKFAEAGHGIAEPLSCQG